MLNLKARCRSIVQPSKMILESSSLHRPGVIHWPPSFGLQYYSLAINKIWFCYYKLHTASSPPTQPCFKSVALFHWQFGLLHAVVKLAHRRAWWTSELVQRAEPLLSLSGQTGLRHTTNYGLHGTMFTSPQVRHSSLESEKSTHKLR